ncbi:enoyl-CoA hydratase/isomerase family protein [Chloroflexota bacterium]
MPLTGLEILLYEKKDQIVYITLNRPERMNALSYDLGERLAAAWAQYNEDDDARVAIITGIGDRAFSAGMDLKDQAERAEAGGPDISELKQSPTLGAGLEIHKPIIAAINGLAIAGGFKLAMDCDIRIAAEHAEFGVAEVKVGRGTPWAVPMLWMVPFGVTLEIFMTGERISAQRAYEIGFVNKVVPGSQLMSEATKMAEILRDNAPLSVKAVKQMFYSARDMGCTEALAMSTDLWKPVYASEDAQEGPRAFAQKRKPIWKGR